MIFGYILINRIQPFEAANISAAFILCRPKRKHNRSHTYFKISFKTTFHALLLCIHISGIHCINFIIIIIIIKMIKIFSIKKCSSLSTIIIFSCCYNYNSRRRDGVLAAKLVDKLCSILHNPHGAWSSLSTPGSSPTSLQSIRSVPR